MNRLMRRRADKIEAVLSHRRAALEAKAASVLAEAHDLGHRFGLRVFADATNSLTERMTERPSLTFDVAHMLATYADAAKVITLVSSAGESPNEANVTHWQSANSAFGGEVVKALGVILRDAAERLDAMDEFEGWFDGMADLVIATVLPLSAESPPLQEWVAERLALYADVKERLGIADA